MAIFTIGHSTHAAEAFVALLRQHGIRQLADVRTVPRSRRHPHFSRETLPDILAEAHIEYRHFAALGGLRRPSPDSANTAWVHPSFRGYADHMQTKAFEEGVHALMGYAAQASTAVLCAEALWWQCHRRLLADALVARGAAVVHILATGKAQPHEVTPFARISGLRVTYPGLL